MKRAIILATMSVLCFLQVGWGQIPRTMSYQGVLKDAGGNPVTDTKTITFRLYDAVDAVTGSAIWSEQLTVQIDNGVFSVILGETTALPDLFPAPAWLGIDVGATGEELSPRTRLTSSPYSFHALRADTAQYAFSAATGGAGWSLTGNAGTTSGAHFLGTTDNTALQLRVNNARALRLEPGTTPNLIGGYYGNTVTSGVVGATIGGGGYDANTNRVTDGHGTIGGGSNNQAGNNDGSANATVGGGWMNTASGPLSTVPRGENNTAAGAYSFAGGRQAKANHDGAFVWADGTNADFASTAVNQFLIRAAGGVGIGTTSPGEALDVAGKIKSENTRISLMANNQISTTSTNWVDMPDLSLTIETGALPVLIMANIHGLTHSDLNENIYLRLLIDGSITGDYARLIIPSGILQSVTLTYLSTFTEGTHTIKVQWYTNQPTVTASNSSTYRHLLVWE